eukprot:4100303-Alexandrium_andersonii.AAC.1
MGSLGRWKKLRLYEVDPFSGYSNDVGPERRLNVLDALGYKEAANTASHAHQQICYPDKDSGEIPRQVDGAVPLG